MLTISQLAGYVGVTVRAVRHYHQRGLLAEPERDASGYRRYGAGAVVDLIRIATLAAAGVPLARIGGLLEAGPEDFARAVAEIDGQLERRIRELQEQRRRITALTAGDQLFVPAEVAELLAGLRRIGVSERLVRLERDAWILLAARSPGLAREAARGKAAHLADTAFQRIYLAFDRAYDWDPADPRLAELAAGMLDVARRYQLDPQQLQATGDVEDPVTVSLLTSVPGASSPAWQQLGRLLEEQAGAAAG